VLDSSRRIAAELEPPSAVRAIITEACALLQCERATVWLAADKQVQGVGAAPTASTLSSAGDALARSEGRELVMMQGTAGVAGRGAMGDGNGGGEHLPPPRLAWGSGIAGTVAATGEPLVIADAREDGRFDRGLDEKLGFHTRAVCALPILDANGDVVGVLQAINKKATSSPADGTQDWSGSFGASDVEALGVLSM